MTIQLGQKVRDTHSGIEGKVIAITDWLYGCRRCVIQPFGEKADGGPKDSFSVDEPQCEVVEDTPAPVAAPRHGNRDDAVATRRN